MPASTIRESSPSVGADWVLAKGSRDFKGDGPIAASAAGYDVVLLRRRGGLRAYEGRCPHQGALLGEGEIDGAALVCRNHRWRFDVDSGARIGGGACLRACPVKEEGGEVLVDVSALRSSLEQAAPPAKVRRISDLPGPRGLPLLGNSLSLDPNRLHLVLERWASEYGPAYLVRLGRLPIVVVSDPEVTQPLFRERPDTYRRVSVVEAVFEEMRIHGLFSAEGPAWRPQRRLAMEALSQRNLRAFYPMLARTAERLHARWSRAALQGRVLDLNDELKRFTVDVTTQLVLGHDINTIERADDDVIQRDLEQVFPALNRRINAVFPYWRYVKLPADYRLDRALASLKEWLDGRIREARERLDADPSRAEQPGNFIESMLVSRDESGQPFSNEALFANAMTMLLAGEDTTAYTLSWAVHHMCEEPGPRAALRAEADRVLGQDRVPATMEKVDELTYAAAAANEAMRLRNIAPLMFFEPLREVMVGDVAVSPGVGIVALMRVPTSDERRFTDAQAFRPERWITPPPAHDASVHRPFGSGPRMCPGRTLALVEMRIVLATLYKAFDVERVGRAADVEERTSFTMTPVGVRVRLRPRAA